MAQAPVTNQVAALSVVHSRFEEQDTRGLKRKMTDTTLELERARMCAEDARSSSGRWQQIAEDARSSRDDLLDKKIAKKIATLDALKTCLTAMSARAQERSSSKLDVILVAIDVLSKAVDVQEDGV